MPATATTETFLAMLTAARHINGIETEVLLHGTLSPEDRGHIATVYNTEHCDLGVDHSLLAMLNSAERRAGLEKFFRRFGIMEVRYEMDIAEGIIRAADPRQAYDEFQLYEDYRETIRTEVAGAGLRAGDRVLFLGSGPLPVSLVQLLEHHGIQGAGIELLPHVAALSRRLLAALGHAATIPITTGDHFSITPGLGYTHVCVAYDAEPKEEIFAHLREVLPDGTTVSYRFAETGAGASSFRNLRKEQNGYREFAGFTTLSLQQPQPPARYCTAFLRKQAAA